MAVLLELKTFLTVVQDFHMAVELISGLFFQLDPSGLRCPWKDSQLL
jgi:hypothetical protein